MDVHAACSLKGRTEWLLLPLSHSADIRGCDFTNLNLSGKVLSGVQMQASAAGCCKEGGLDGG